MNKTRALYILSLHTIFLALVLMLYFIYQLVYPFKIVELNSKKFSVNKDIYKPGEYIEYTLDFTKHYNFTPKVRYYLVNGFIYPLAKTSLARPIGKQLRVLNLRLPDETPDGVYHIQIDLEYEINVFRKINYLWESESFEVRK